MGRFSSGDVIDLPELHRRGLVKFPDAEKEIDEIDFTSISSNVPVVPTASESNPVSSGVSDFLSDFSNIGASNVSNSFSDNSKNEKSDSENIDSVKLVQDLKWRIENNEYKLEQLIERLVALEKKLS